MKKTPHIQLADIPLPPLEAHFVVEYCKDKDIHRAAEACFIEPEQAFALRSDNLVATEIHKILRAQVSIKDVDSEWLMQELYNLHLMCLQGGKYGTSHQILKTIGALGLVDAYAAEKVELKSDRDILDRLHRGKMRKRRNTEKVININGPSFL